LFWFGFQASYRAAQTAAQQERLGLWSDTQTPVPPWEYGHAAHWRHRGESQKRSDQICPFVHPRGMRIDWRCASLHHRSSG